MPPISEIVAWASAGLFGVVLVIATISDVQERRIPNWTILAILAAFVPWLWAEPSASIGSSLAAAGVLFLGSVALYAGGVLGAGDSKLISAAGLFVGWNGLLPFVLATVVAGGVVALTCLAADPRRTMTMIATRFKVPFGRGIPYGAAIAVAALTIVVGRLAA